MSSVEMSDKAMKKLLFVNISLYNGGAEKSLVNLLNEIPVGLYEIDLMLFRPEGMFIKQVPNHVNIVDTPKELKRLYSFSFMKLIATIISRIFSSNGADAAGFRWKYFYSRIVKQMSKEYDVAIAYMSGEATYFIDEKVNAKRKLTWVHNDYKQAGFSDKYDREHFRNMDAVVTISDACLDVLNDVFPELSNKTYNIANITSSALTRKRADEFEPLEYSDDEKTLLSIGRLNEQKGFDMAIRAAALLKERGIQVKWYVIGDGSLKKELTSQIKKYGVEDCFRLLGTRENPYPYIKHCTVFVQTSRYEGKSVVLDEAKILAKPIVVTAYPTVNDQIKNDLEGIVVPISAEGIADGIQKMLADDDLRNGFQKYLAGREYGNQHVVKSYCELFEQ